MIIRKFFRLNPNTPFLTRVKTAVKWSFDAKKIMQRDYCNKQSKQQQQQQQQPGKYGTDRNDNQQQQQQRQQTYELKEWNLKGIKEEEDDDGEQSQTESEKDLKMRQAYYRCNRSTSINGLPVCLPVEDDSVPGSTSRRHLTETRVPTISATVIHAESRGCEVFSGDEGKRSQSGGGGGGEGGYGGGLVDGERGEKERNERKDFVDTESLTDQDSTDCVVVVDKLPALPARSNIQPKKTPVGYYHFDENRKSDLSAISSGCYSLYSVDVDASGDGDRDRDGDGDREGDKDSLTDSNSNAEYGRDNPAFDVVSYL